MQLPKRSRTRIRHKQTVKPKIARLPHRSAHADIRRNPAEHQIPDPPHIKQQSKVGMLKSALARLVHKRLAGKGVQLRDDVVAGLAPDQEAAERARVADAAHGGEALAALALAGRQRREVWTVALAGVVDGEPEGPEGFEQRLDLGDDGPRRGDGVALGFEVAALLADWGVG